MQNPIFKKITTIIFAIVIFLNFAPVSFAANPIDDSPANNPGWSLVPCGTKSNPAECDWNQLIKLANNVVIFLVWLSASLATIAFCYAGFLYMTAFGEMGKIEQAHGIFKSAIIGLFFVLCGWLIIATILRVLIDRDLADIGSIVPFQNVEKIQGQPR